MPILCFHVVYLSRITLCRLSLSVCYIVMRRERERLWWIVVWPLSVRSSRHSAKTTPSQYPSHTVANFFAGLGHSDSHVTSFLSAWNQSAQFVQAVCPVLLWSVDICYQFRHFPPRTWTGAQCSQFCHVRSLHWRTTTITLHDFPWPRLCVASEASFSQ